MAWAAAADLPLVGVDNLPGSVPIETAALPRPACWSSARRARASRRRRGRLRTGVLDRQFGSTRSINAGVASGIAMHTWIRQHALDPER